MTARRFGANYNEQLTATEIAALVRKSIRAKLKAGEWPDGLRTSVRVERYSMGQSITVRLTFPHPIYHAEADLNDRRPWIERLHPEVREVRADAERLLASYNYDGSDSMSDYYDVNFSPEVICEPAPGVPTTGPRDGSTHTK